MTEIAHERPSIHIGVIGAADASLCHWVEVGAEEEGLPAEPIASDERDAVAAAFAAAQSSRFGVGVGLGAGQIVLHEAHMPQAQPVLAFDLGADAGRACRLIGGDAARMVVRLPLRFADAADEQPEPADRGWSTAEVQRIARIVAQRMRERGL